MRREQILTVCANFLIKPDMDIIYRKDDKDRRVLVFKAIDCSDDPKVELFTCKLVSQKSEKPVYYPLICLQEQCFLNLKIDSKR